MIIQGINPEWAFGQAINQLLCRIIIKKCSKFSSMAITYKLKNLFNSVLVGLILAVSFIIRLPSLLIQCLHLLFVPLSKMQEAEEKKWEEYRIGLDNAIKNQAAINEQRKKEGKDPIEIKFQIQIFQENQYQEIMETSICPGKGTPYV